MRRINGECSSVQPSAEAIIAPSHSDIAIEVLSKAEIQEQYNSACLSNGLIIGPFQFSNKISVTLVSVLFTPPLVNPIS